MIYYCQHCGVRFKRDHSKVGRTVKHCSYACKSAATRKIKPEALREAAFSGAPVVDMAKQFGVTRRKVREWLERDGLLQLWREQRYI